jgi:hypothetical protein
VKNQSIKHQYNKSVAYVLRWVTLSLIKKKGSVTTGPKPKKRSNQTYLVCLSFSRVPYSPCKSTRVCYVLRWATLSLIKKGFVSTGPEPKERNQAYLVCPRFCLFLPHAPYPPHHPCGIPSSPGWHLALRVFRRVFHH